jgi:cell wall assembly regulator SMI1
MSVTFKPLGISGEQLALMRQHGLKLDKRTQRSMLTGAASPKPTLEQISRLEEALGHELPNDYKDFQIRENGGKPSLNGIKLPLETLLNGTVLSYLHGINHAYAAYTVSEARRRVNGELGANFIPIGEDPAGNYFVMNLSPAEHGAVYFWNRDAFEDEADAAMVKIAESFSDFINLLY